jgi:hypothetical protein
VRRVQRDQDLRQLRSLGHMHPGARPGHLHVPAAVSAAPAQSVGRESRALA